LRGEWWQLHDFDLSSNRERKWAVHATRMGEKINKYMESFGEET
jgi:hypothetical protein